jgi:hypothetical protein
LVEVDGALALKAIVKVSGRKVGQGAGIMNTICVKRTPTLKIIGQACGSHGARTAVVRNVT